MKNVLPGIFSPAQAFQAAATRDLQFLTREAQAGRMTALCFVAILDNEDEPGNDTMILRVRCHSETTFGQFDRLVGGLSMAHANAAANHLLRYQAEVEYEDEEP